MRFRYVVVGLIGLATVSGWLFLRGDSKVGQIPQRVIPVKTLKIENNVLPDIRIASGWVESLERVSVRPRVEGEIKEILVSEGTQVAAGDLIFRLDARVAEADLRQARAALQQDLAQAEKARRDRERAEKLAALGVGSQGQKETAQANAGALQAAIAGGKARTESAQLLLSFTEIRAPISGRLSEIKVKTGNLVRPGDAQVLADIIQLNPIAVAFTVPDVHVAAINDAMQRGSVPVRVLGSVQQNCTLQFIDHVVDRSSATVKAKAVCANADETLLPGQYVSVEVVLDQPEKFPLIPDSAILQGQEGPFVFVASQDNKAEWRKISILRQARGTALIASGIQASENLVIEGQHLLSNGATIVVANPSDVATGAQP